MTERTIDGMTKAEMLSIVRQFEVDGDPSSGLHIPEGGDLARVCNAIGRMGYKIDWGANAKEKLRHDIPLAFRELALKEARSLDDIRMGDESDFFLRAEVLEAAAGLSKYAAEIKVISACMKLLEPVKGCVAIRVGVRDTLCQALDEAAEIIDGLAMGAEGDLEDQQREDANG